MLAAALLSAAPCFAAVGGSCDTSSCSWENAGPPFTLEQGLFAVHLSAAAYCGKDGVEKWKCGGNCDAESGVGEVTVINAKCPDANTCHHDLQAFVAWHEPSSSILVVFRGTDNFVNWATNLETTKANPYGQNGGAVHAGFYAAWRSLREAGVWAAAEKMAIDKALSPARVQVTGHSLGGAMATLAARDFAAETINGMRSIVQLMSVAAPRSGDAQFMVQLHGFLAASWRLTHNKDVVPHVPLQAMGFQHAGREIYSATTGPDFVVCDGSGEDPKCSNSCFGGLVPEPGQCTSIPDHLVYLGYELGFGSGCVTSSLAAGQDEDGGDGDKLTKMDVAKVAAVLSLPLFIAGFLLGRRSMRRRAEEAAAEPCTPTTRQPFKEMEKADDKGMDI
eukprot:TRINITY_DN1922_c0_g2_i1.p3 TRINITY_DN1922_c0_g2~~TRINITY_DN1922_c0_g2_i1.p3  ORF type:complete len:433 (+),score=151.14 TRINITY_DN1922_c0_g2_i1:129-1301(+)